MIAGIDEVGRGCIAGAVVAAVVILDKSRPIQGLDDSKKLTPRRRQMLCSEIQTLALDWSIGRAEACEIDRINILQASLLAMQRAFFGLNSQPDWVYVDGNVLPSLNCSATAVIGGDQLVPEISAASILAKVHRDKEMQFLDKLYPGYQFSKHKGYPTKAHLLGISQRGVTEIHRTSFAPVKKLISN
jgi:ribonuclease HII